VVVMVSKISIVEIVGGILMSELVPMLQKIMRAQFGMKNDIEDIKIEIANIKRQLTLQEKCNT